MSARHTPARDASPVAPGYFVTRDGLVLADTGWRGCDEPRLMQQDMNSHGYPRVRITISGQRVVRLVHSLVAQAFLPVRPSPLHEVRHLNGDRTDNRAENLAWGTRKENAADREQHGRTSRGEAHGEAIKRGLAGVAHWKKRATVGASRV